ncbi:MAG TPA: hypothetical protein VNU71_04480 [Burkholderiaceae bacterium]|nr:hypothetical protein [Burkholderiaceae bacterium]
MNKILNSLVCMTFASVAGVALAQDAMPKEGAMVKKDAPMMKKDVNAQDCKDHMAAHPAAKKDPEAMKMDKQCAELMKKGADPTKNDMAPATPMKK